MWPENDGMAWLYGELEKCLGLSIAPFPGQGLREDDIDPLLPANLHSRVREAIIRCLQRDLGRRYSSIADARYEIEQALADPGGVLVQPVTVVASRRKPRTILLWAVSLVLMAIIAGIAVWNLRKPEPKRVMRFEYELPEGLQFSNLGDPAIAVSPDGKQFVYSTPEGLYLRSVDELAAKIIAGTEESTQQPFFSPDGKWIGYLSVADRKLKKISTNGGAPVALCDVTQLSGASWYEDNTIVYGQLRGDIMRISAKGGTPESLIKAKGGFIWFPQVLPDGESVLFASTIGGVDPKIRVQSLKSGEPKELFAGIWAQYLPTGYIAYGLANDSNLFVVPFDIDRLEVTGGAVAIVQGILQGAVANSGTLIYLPGSAVADPNNQRILVWVDRKGKEEPLLAQPDFYKYPNISPDGNKIAFTDYGGETHDIWIWDLIRKTLMKLTFEGKDNICPVWSTDGKRIAFLSFGRGSSGNVSGIYWKNADGTGQDEQLSSKSLTLYCWSSDGKTLVGVEFASALNAEHIGMLSIEGDHAQKTLLQQASIERSPKISPDGRWMAYTSNESGREEIYVRPFPEVNKGRWPISTSGGGAPLWSPDGRELFYLNGDAVMVAPVKTDPSFDMVGTPQVLFRGKFVGPYMGEGTPWDIHPNGKKFLMIKPPADTGATPAATSPQQKIIVVVNWFEELKQRVSVK